MRCAILVMHAPRQTFHYSCSSKSCGWVCLCRDLSRNRSQITVYVPVVYEQRVIIIVRYSTCKKSVHACGRIQTNFLVSWSACPVLYFVYRHLCVEFSVGTAILLSFYSFNPDSSFESHFLLKKSLLFRKKKSLGKKLCTIDLRWKKYLGIGIWGY